ncbi:MAG TPA: molybdopterin cofactor-binding domain-containing protein [Gemmatimonadaceae bacterium]|nr:molybdopterin cofactor-binding domain-containing protein [Gemmatimonadaceae bacterium]
MTTRREFLKRAGGGLAVFLVAPRLEHVESLESAFESWNAQTTDPISAWLHVDGKGQVTVYTGKVEFGQGIRTSLAQHVAEELRAPVESIRLVMGDTELTPFDMGTFGSRSTPQMGMQLRRAGASARELLIGLAAERWKVDRAGLVAENGQVVDTRTKRPIGFGELTAGRKLTETIRADVAPKPATAWTIAGKSLPKVGAREIVTGRHEYTSDMRLPGMLHGRVLRTSGTSTTIADVDTKAASAIKGAVVVRDGTFVGVAAPSIAVAGRALAALDVTYGATSMRRPSSTSVFAYLKSTGSGGAGRQAGGEGGGASQPFVLGDAAGALAYAALKVERTYTVAYIAHVPLEPRAAVAQWTRDAEGDRVTVWTGTQRPFAVRDEVARELGVPQARVRVIVPDTGSGYGGKHTGEVAVEAARLAKGAGKPVKLVWSREEEFRWAYFRPAGVIDVAAAVRPDGTIAGWTFDNYNSGPAAIRPTYAIANQRVTYHPSDSPLRQGSYRGLAATANNFAREMHVDELARVIKADPLAFRLKNLEDERMRAVLQAAAERFGWGKRVASGRGVGIACGFDKGGYIAACAEVAADAASGAVRITRVVAAFDCGAVVNPAGLRSQISGGIIQGIGGALFEAVDFEDGVVTNAKLAQYRVPRFSDVPEIEVILVNRKDLPSMGAGETPIIAIAPAAGAAIFDATGVRPLSLPMARGGLKASTT